MTRPLLPAQAAFLAEPSSWSGGKCLQAALLTLLGRGHLTFVEKERMFGQRGLRLLDGDGERLPGHLASVKYALQAHGGQFMRASEAAKALQKAFGSDYRRYIHDKLALELIDARLVTREARRWLGLIPYVRYERTPAGEALAAPILRLMKEVGDLKRLIGKDPDRAAALARAAGILLVLSPDARRQIPKLKDLVERGNGGSGDGGTWAAGVGGEDKSDREWEVGVELGDFAFASDAAGLLDSIGAVGDFTGGDGGGDGGDGGGGGD